MIYEQFYDEINAELQMMAAISVEEQAESHNIVTSEQRSDVSSKIFVGSGDICTWEMKHVQQ